MIVEAPVAAGTPTTVGSTSITVSSSATLAVGMSVSGAGLVPDFTAVVDGTHVTVTNPAIATSSTASLTFFASADGTGTAFANSPPVFVSGSVSTNPMLFQPLREQLSRGISSMVDNLALFGTGPANGQPLGVFAATGSPTKLSTSMTWINHQTYRTTILQTNLGPDSYGGIVSLGML